MDDRELRDLRLRHLKARAADAMKRGRYGDASDRRAQPLIPNTRPPPGPAVCVYWRGSNVNNNNNNNATTNAATNHRFLTGTPRRSRCCSRRRQRGRRRARASSGCARCC